MTKFDPKFIVPASASKEFQGEKIKRTAKDVLLDGIKRQLELFTDPKADGRRWFTVGKQEVALSLRVGNKPLKLVGEETKVVVPLAMFEEAMKHFSDRATAGEFDPQLVSIGAAMESRSVKISASRAAKK